MYSRLITRLLENPKQFYCSKRYKSHHSSLAFTKKKLTAMDKALEHFDDFYGNIFKKQWPSIRLALLSTQKYIAVINNFSDPERIQSEFENFGGINIERLLEVQNGKLNSAKHIKNKKQNVEKLDVKIQEFIKKKQEEEHASFYASKEENVFPSYSLEKSVSENRLIEPLQGLSASTVSEFVPTSKLIGLEDWIPESQHYSHYADNQDYSIKIEEQDSIDFPPHLHAYTFENGNVERFPPPKKGTTGVSDYYLLNGGSLLPVLALDLKPGDNVLDMCASPGGKGLLCLQTLFPRQVVLNDISDSRINRIKNVMNEYFYDFEEKQEKGEIILTRIDGRMFNIENKFDKILVDVPCTTDRHSVMQDDNNIFKSGRIKERIKIPELQSELLINALKLVKVGGIVVYSTCSLSPTQNDGVIALSLRRLLEQTDHQFVVVDMRKALKPSRILYNFGNNLGLKCGHLVIPCLPANFGPTYFCKILRIK